MTTTQGSAQGAVADDAACLLNYRPATHPAPIQVGSAQSPAQAVLNTAALPAGQKVYCNQIIMAVPVGPDEGALFQQAPVASLNTGKWAVTSTVQKKGHELGIEEDETDYTTFIFECRDPTDYLINYNLVFGLTGSVAPVASECTVLIMENSGTTSDPSTFTEKRCSYTLTTSTPIFYLTNFVATATGSPTVPATEFANGADINFAWDSNGTFFQLYEKSNPQPVYAGLQTSFTLKGGVKTDATFFLVAMVSGNPSGDKPQSGYQPIYLFDALTVTVSNPDLTPKSANVSGNAAVGGTLSVKGATTLDSASVGGTLAVGGATTLANASVGGTLGVTGKTTLADATVGGTLNASHDLNVTGTFKTTGAANLAGASVANSLNVDQSDLNNGTLYPGFAFGARSGEGISSKRTAGGNKFGLDFYTQEKVRLSITNGGNVGIGTNAPTQALLVVDGFSTTDHTAKYGFLNSSYPTGIYNGGTQGIAYSIWATARVAASEFNAYSDERIKEIAGRSDGAADLRTLLAIEVTDYRYKDVHAKGDTPHKKFIAQQVEQVFPQAVGKATDVVPDIYRQARFADGWVELETDLKAGERVRLISEQGEGVHEVLEVRPDRFRTDIEPAGSRLFVYGREVRDFRTLDYDAVAALNVSATQQLKRETDAEVEALRAENEALLDRLQRLESRMEAALSLLATTNGAGLKL